jgi:hypothetical protein
MIHPTRSDNDMTIVLKETAEKVYSGKITQKINPGNWWVRITPPNNTWYIEGRILLPQNQSLILN